MKRRKPMKRIQVKRKTAQRAPRKQIKKRGKMSAYYEDRKEDRENWNREQVRRCMICGEAESFAMYFGLQVHEIERRSHSRTSFERANYLLVCEPCHSGPLATMKHAKQLAYKLLRDPDNFDLEAWLRLRDANLKAPNRVTLAEVQIELQAIQRDK